MESSKPGRYVIILGMSRSGTTLLNTLVSANPLIAGCFDVAPKPFGVPLVDVSSALASSIQAANLPAEREGALAVEDFQRLVGSVSASSFKPTLVRLLQTTRRSGIAPERLVVLLERLGREMPEVMTEKRQSLSIAKAIVDDKRTQQGLATGAAKLIYPPELVASVFGEVHFAGIVRDPRDVLVSHIGKGWEDDPAVISKRWLGRLKVLRKLEAEKRASITRFEDLVADVGATMSELFVRASVPVAEAVALQDAEVFGIEDAFASKDQLFWSGQIESARVATHVKGLDRERSEAIVARCGAEMSRLGYQVPS